MKKIINDGYDDIRRELSIYFAELFFSALNNDDNDSISMTEVKAAILRVLFTN
jgi:hypothetical protein